MTSAKVNGYVLGELLGHGGMGDVFAAQQPLLGRPVALKLLRPELAGDPSIVARFHTEALAGCRLSHPNVAGVIEFGVTAGGTPFLVMERIAGESLGRLLEREGTLSVRRAGALVGQLLVALDAVHVAGVIHADVKIDNILVDRRADGREVAILIDFGIARLADQPPRADDTTERTLSGTPEYLAPEVIVGGSPTAASDIYAAGIVLYELLTGATPFCGGSAAGMFRRHLEDDVIVPSLRSPDAGISAELDRILLCALAKDPTTRFASAGQFAAALAAALPAADRDLSTRVMPAPRFSSEAPTQDWPASRPRFLGAGTRPPSSSGAEGNDPAGARLPTRAVRAQRGPQSARRSTQLAAWCRRRPRGQLWPS